MLNQYQMSLCHSHIGFGMVETFVKAINVFDGLCVMPLNFKKRQHVFSHICVLQDPCKHRDL